jgi:2-keto-4-pentenoate hydratase
LGKAMDNEASMDREAIDAAARALVMARAAAAGSLSCWPNNRTPESPTEAYAVQAAVANRLGTAVIGWKVAIDPGGVGIAAPVFRIASSDEQLGYLAGLALETEIGFRLARDLPVRDTPYERHEIAAAIASVHPCFEIVHGRLANSAARSLVENLADGLANHAVVVGEGRAPAGILDFKATTVTLSCNGAGIISGVGRHAAGDPLAPLLAYANSGGDRLGGLRARQLVVTGTLTGLTSAQAGALYEADIEAIGTVAVSFGKE